MVTNEEFSAHVAAAEIDYLLHFTVLAYKLSILQDILNSLYY